MGVLATAVTMKPNYIQIDKNQLLLRQCSGSKGFGMIGKKGWDQGGWIGCEMVDEGGHNGNTARLDLIAS